MNNTRKLKLASVLALVLVISACGNNDDRRDGNANADNSVGAGAGTGTGGGNAVTATIPDSAKANGDSFNSFLNSLKNDETSEPLLIGDGFAVPADETSEPRPLG